MASTRRLAAILTADVAGYSRLMGADEEGTHERLRVHLDELVDPLIRDHHGRIVKTTGDGLLAEFASVVDAVRSAAEVQRRMIHRERDVPDDRRIRFRIGINLGDVIVEGDDIYGNGVNIAARLEALAEPGGICVSRVVRDQVRDRLDIAFDDMGEQQVKNIARPVRVFRVQISETSQRAPGVGSPEPAPLPLPDKPSIAVLAFANMSSDPEQEFLADGIAEDVITALSRFPSLFVIARNSSFTYKGRALDVKQVGRELGVRYVLGGSLRKADKRIRVTAQLVEAETGSHVWAERYDRDLADIFAVQDEIADAVTIAVAPAIAEAERRRAMRKPPENLDAWAAYQRGVWHYSKATLEDFRLAEQFFQQAIALDPGFAAGYIGFAKAQVMLPTTRPTANLREVLASGERHARQAVALDPGNPEACAALAHALFVRGDLEGGLAEAEHAIALCPNLGAAWAVKGSTLIFSDRPKEGLAAYEIARRLDPRSPYRSAQLLIIAVGHYYCRDYEAAAETVRQAIRSYPDLPHLYRWLAAALGQLGRAEEARQALAEAIARGPDVFDLYVRARPPWVRPEDHAHMLEGLRKAGWEG
jgi:adenylate cyclase